MELNILILVFLILKKYYFHKKCINAWLKLKEVCPLCDTKVDRSLSLWERFLLGGDIFDPWGMHANKVNSPSISFRKVGKKTFQHYLKYLETRRSAFLLKAKRELVNE